MTIDELRKAVRDEWGRVTPFRMGMYVSAHQVQIDAVPYPAGTSGARNYEEGLAFGRTRRVLAQVAEKGGAA